jgi:DNA-directed RNA polymerase specialized sigma24 family protein
MQRPQPSDRSEAALYWTAVSLIVCEGLPLKEAAERLQISEEELRSIMLKREAVCSQKPSQELWQ